MACKWVLGTHHKVYYHHFRKSEIGSNYSEKSYCLDKNELLQNFLLNKKPTYFTKTPSSFFRLRMHRINRQFC